MKHIINRNLNKIIIVIIFLLILITGYGIIYSNMIYNNNIIEYKAKISLLNSKVEKQSDIEILQSRATRSNGNSKTFLEDINKYKELIVQGQAQYERSLLRERCYKDQISRMIDKVEYNVGYCEDDSILDNFRSVKLKR